MRSRSSLGRACIRLAASTPSRRLQHILPRPHPKRTKLARSPRPPRVTSPSRQRKAKCRTVPHPSTDSPRHMMLRNSRKCRRLAKTGPTNPSSHELATARLAQTVTRRGHRGATFTAAGGLTPRPASLGSRTCGMPRSKVAAEGHCPVCHSLNWVVSRRLRARLAKFLVRLPWVNAQLEGKWVFWADDSLLVESEPWQPCRRR